MKAKWDRDYRAAVQQRKEGHYYAHPQVFVDLEDRTNISIYNEDTNATVLQRFSPTSARSISSINDLLEVGSRLMKELFDFVGHGMGNAERHGAVVCHLGMWYNMHWQIGWTTEHDRCKPASDKMLDWISQYFHSYVATLEPLLKEDFKASLDKRGEGFEWLQSKMPDGHCDLLHPWWTLAAVISGITTSRHPNSRDFEPSILINFGCKVIFEVDGSSVCLHPGNVLFFRASLWHKARAVDGATAAEISRRFAVSLSVRKDIVTMVDTANTVVRADGSHAGPSATGTRVRQHRAHVPK
ncbi:hypothetical protein CBS101457_000424 [Exobasidium rhododendri]|nr:hypothetical protein CBS101457_000424 [Exobasidium rhododendri]